MSGQRPDGDALDRDRADGDSRSRAAVFVIRCDFLPADALLLQPRRQPCGFGSNRAAVKPSRPHTASRQAWARSAHASPCERAQHAHEARGEKAITVSADELLFDADERGPTTPCA